MADRSNTLRPPVADKQKRAQSLNIENGAESFSRLSVRSNVSSLDGQRRRILKRPPMKIVTYKLDFLKNAKAKVHTFENINYKPGGGNVNYDETEVGWEGDTDLGGQLNVDGSQNPAGQTNQLGSFDQNGPNRVNFDAVRSNKQATGQGGRRNETGDNNGNKQGGAKSFYVDDKDGATVKITVLDDSKRRPANREPSSKSSERGQRPRRFSKFGEESQNSGDADGDTTKLPAINGERDGRNGRQRRAPSPEVGRERSRNPAPGRNEYGDRDGGRRPSASGTERDPNEERGRRPTVDARRDKAGDGKSETNRDVVPRARRRDLSENTGARRNLEDQNMGESDSADSDTTLVFASSPQTAKSRNDRGDNVDRLRRLAASDANVHQRGQYDGRDEKRGAGFEFGQERNGPYRNEVDSQGAENGQNRYMSQNERNGFGAPAGQNGYGMQGGQNWQDGRNGQNGQNFQNGSNWQSGQSGQNGPNWQSGQSGQNGPNRQNGQNGQSGQNWQNGQNFQNGQNRFNAQNGYGRQDQQFGNNGNPGPGRFNEMRQPRFDEPSDRSYDGQAYGDIPSGPVNQYGGGGFMTNPNARSGPGAAKFAPQMAGMPAEEIGEKLPPRVPVNQFEADHFGAGDAVPQDNEDTRTRTAFGEFTSGTTYGASRMGKSRATLSSDEPPEPKKIGIVEKIDFSKGKEAVVFKFEKRLKTRLPRVAYLAHASDPGPKNWNVLPRADKTQMRKDKVPINYSTLHDQSVVERQQYEQYVQAKQFPPPNMTSRVTGRESMQQTSRATSRNERDVYYLNLPSKGFNGQLFLPPIDQAPNQVYNTPPTRMSVPNQPYGNTSQSSPIPENANDEQHSNQVYQYTSIPNGVDRARGDPRTGGADLAGQYERSMKYDQGRYVEASRPVVQRSDPFVSQSKPTTDEEYRAMQRGAQANWTEQRARNDQDGGYTQIQTQIVGHPLATDNEEFGKVARRAQSFGENDSRKAVIMSDKETETEMDNPMDAKKVRNTSGAKPSATANGLSEATRPKMSSIETQTSANTERRRSRSTETADERRPDVQLDNNTTSVVNRNGQAATAAKQLPADDMKTTKPVRNSEMSQVPRKREEYFASNQRPSQIEISNAPPTFLTDGATNYVVAYANMTVTKIEENKPPSNDNNDEQTVTPSGMNSLKQASEHAGSDVLLSQKQADARKIGPIDSSTGPITQSTTSTKIDELVNRMRKLKNSNPSKTTADAAVANTAPKDENGTSSGQNTIPETSMAALPGRSPSITESEKLRYSTMQMLINYRPPPTSFYTAAPQTSEKVPEHANSDLRTQSHSVDMRNVGSSYPDVDQASIAPSTISSSVKRNKKGFADIHSRRASLQSKSRRSSIVYLFD